jgi:hypothetical protein
MDPKFVPLDVVNRVMKALYYAGGKCRDINFCLALIGQAHLDLLENAAPKEVPQCPISRPVMRGLPRSQKSEIPLLPS